MNTDTAPLFKSKAKPFRDHSEIDRIEVYYWSSDRYGSYQEADEAAAVRHGYYYGYTAACDAIETACAVADLLQYKAHKDDIRVRVRVSYLSDWINLPECYLAESIAALNELF